MMTRVFLEIIPVGNDEIGSEIVVRERERGKEREGQRESGIK